MSSAPAGNRRALLGWAFYDFGNSAFTTIIVTFIFPIYLANVYFGGGVETTLNTPLDTALRQTEGQVQWGKIVAYAAGLIAISAPILGSIADLSGRRKPWILGFSLLCIFATSLLFLQPDPVQFPLLLAIAFVVANYGFEMGSVFNNAQLPGLTTTDRMGRWSGWAWGLGYSGGLLCLLICLPLVLFSESLFGDAGLGARLSFLVVAVWFAIFMLPMLMFTPDQRQGLPIGQAVSKGLGETWATAREIWGQPNLTRFMIARLIYNDGLVTIFSMGALFAALRYGMDTVQIIAFGILLNITAVIGSVFMARQDDLRGKKWVLNISICLLILVFLLGLSLPYLMGGHEAALWPFVILGGALGLFVGPIQAASRSFVAVVSPPEQATRYFGFYELTGKATAFLGPLLVSSFTLFAAQRLNGGDREAVAARGLALDMGMLSIPLLLLIGLITLQSVKEPKIQA